MDTAQGELIRVRGLVQGVGFRPTVWRLAYECGLTGDVRNDNEGVLIRAWGHPSARKSFLRRLMLEAPPLARIDSVVSLPLAEANLSVGFHIRASRAGAIHTGMVADAATCKTCLRELFDTGDRRYSYPFINCTHCGPRLSIIQGVPYDRANTSMSEFEMCQVCRREYEEPSDRRFHAQPNACPDCGPALELKVSPDFSGELKGDALAACRWLLKAGYIVAIKGIGGVHLAVDATNNEAVARLRRRKQRFQKPFALMARDESVIRRYCTLNTVEAELLRSTAAPIVLLKIHGCESLARQVAPGQNTYGFMLPYSPLHHLLMEGLDTPIVLTSGNRSEEPQCIGNDETCDRLRDIADVFLLHNRRIVNRLDDSVIRVVAGKPALFRRSRGYAPESLQLPPGFENAPEILACGGQLKNTFCLVKDGRATLSQHLGGLENSLAFSTYRETLQLYLKMFDCKPQTVVVDEHPDYLASQMGREWADDNQLEWVGIQHHHAHIAACLADNAIEINAHPILGLALDGMGYGDDGTLWGGEVLLADYCNYRRIGSLTSVPMPGAAKAIRQPWRMAYSHLHRCFDINALQFEFKSLPFFQYLQGQHQVTLERMIAAGFNCPQTSSCGRLFDAAASVLGVCHESSYEGQAAVELEALVDPSALDFKQSYPFQLVRDGRLVRIDPQPMWRYLLQDLQQGASQGVVAARFHSGLAAVFLQLIKRLEITMHDCWQHRIALSGGVFQNVVFSELLIHQLKKMDYEVLLHRRVPSNDGGLSLGQAVVAAARALKQNGRKGKSSCV